MALLPIGYDTELLILLPVCLLGFSMTRTDPCILGVPYKQVYIPRPGRIPHRLLDSHCRMAAHRKGTAGPLAGVQLSEKIRNVNSRLKDSKVLYKVRARKCHGEQRNFDILVRGPGLADCRQALEACWPQLSACENLTRKADVAVALAVGPLDQS